MLVLVGQQRERKPELALGTGRVRRRIGADAHDVNTGVDIGLSLGSQSD
jgi:hypothetical protein